MWIAVDCPEHGCPVLLGSSAFRKLTPQHLRGIAVEYQCTCGHIGVWERRSY